MTATKMINFRLREEDLPRLDAAAERAGMSRSDFIRQAVTEYVARLDGRQGALAAEGKRGKAKPRAEGLKFEDCPKNPACQLVRLNTGVKACRVCGRKWG